MTPCDFSDHLKHCFAAPIAHRGLFSARGPVLPENSLAAFLRARQLGFGVECDVRLDVAGEVCVFHDDKCDRLLGLDADFSKQSLAQLQGVPLQGTAERVPSLKQLLATLEGKVPLVVELKTFSATGGWQRDGETENAVLQALKAYGGPTVLKSFNPHSVLLLQKLMTEQREKWPVGLISCHLPSDGDFPFSDPSEAADLAELNHPAAVAADFISYGVKDLNAQLSQKVLDSCRPLMTWTVRSSELLQKARELRATPVFEEAVLDQLL